MLDGYEPGGQLALTTEVENFPGFPEGILGPELIERTRKQAQRFGTEFRSGAVSSVDLSKRPFTIVAGKETYEAETLIVAAGASARMLGIESERNLLGHGVSTCATCDGAFFRNRDIIVVGGGDTAMEEATFLTKFAKNVMLVHRRNEFRASKIMLDRARANEKIEFMTPYDIEEVHDVSKKSVELVTLRNTETGERRNRSHRRRLRRHRPRSEHESFQGPARYGRERLPDHRRTAPRPTSKEFSPPATFRIITIARRLRRQVPDAWPQSRRNASWRRRRAD